MSSVSMQLSNYRFKGGAARAIMDLLLQREAEWIAETGTLTGDDAHEYHGRFGYQTMEVMSRIAGDLPLWAYFTLDELDAGGIKRTNPDWSDEEKLAALDGEYDRFSIQMKTSLGGTDWVQLVGTAYGYGQLTIYGREPAWGKPVEMAEILELLEPYRLSQEELIESNPVLPFRVFIGHGNDLLWRVLRDELRDKHAFEIEAFEGRPRIGQTIKDILLDMANFSTAAIMVLTRADEMQDGTWRGRQNVVHELGLFQGLLGWHKVIVVMEEGVEPPTNLDGTQQVRFPPGHIQSAVGETVAALNALKADHESGHGHHP